MKYWVKVVLPRLFRKIRLKEPLDRMQFGAHPVKIKGILDILKSEGVYIEEKFRVEVFSGFITIQQEFCVDWQLRQWWVTISEFRELFSSFQNEPAIKALNVVFAENSFGFRLQRRVKHLKRLTF